MIIARSAPEVRIGAAPIAIPAQGLQPFAGRIQSAPPLWCELVKRGESSDAMDDEFSFDMDLHALDTDESFTEIDRTTVS